MSLDVCLVQCVSLLVVILQHFLLLQVAEDLEKERRMMQLQMCEVSFSSLFAQC